MGEADLLALEKKQQLRLALNDVSALVRRMKADTLEWKVSQQVIDPVDVTQVGAQWRELLDSRKRRVEIWIDGELEDGKETKGSRRSKNPKEKP